MAQSVHMLLQWVGLFVKWVICRHVINVMKHTLIQWVSSFVNMGYL